MAVPTHLKALQALEAAIRKGSLRSAAEELSVTPAAVGQRIKSLEDYLGIHLLMRSRSGLVPTPALSAALDHLYRAFRDLEAVADALDLQRGHEIHIACVTDFAELWLKPRLESFRVMHPNVLFCVNGEGETPLRLGPVDCEITFGPPDDDVETLFRDFVIPVSSPENTRRISKARRQDSLEGFPLLHLDFYRNDPEVPNWRRWTRDNRLHRTAPERGIRFQRIAPVLDAILADAGLAICGLALAADHVDQGRLSLPFPVETGTWTEHVFQARFRGGALLRPQVRRFREWLADEADGTRVWLDRVVGTDRSFRSPSDLAP